MPFVSRPSNVRKNILPVDPDLRRDVEQIARPYRRVLNGLAQVVADVSADFARNPDAFAQYQASLNQAIVDSLQGAIPSITNPMTQQTFREAMQAIKNLPRSLGVGISFDQTDPRAVAWARLRSSSMVVQITDEQLQMIRVLVSNALQNGVPIPQLSQQISQVVGLHDRWQRAVSNSFDQDVNALIAEGVNPARAMNIAGEKADKYRQKLIRARAQNIARTEVMAAQNYGTFLGWIQAGEKGLLNLSVTRKQWMVGPSGWKGIAVCDICAPLGDMIVPVTQPFPNGLLTPPAHPNCRCRMILIPPEV